jgi:hypothetical protein
VSGDLLLPDAFKVLMLAKAGNAVSATAFNVWAESNKLPLLPNDEYDAVNDYKDFYNLAYYYIFGN